MSLWALGCVGQLGTILKATITLLRNPPLLLTPLFELSELCEHWHDICISFGCSCGPVDDGLDRRAFQLAIHLHQDCTGRIPCRRHFLECGSAACVAVEITSAGPLMSRSVWAIAARPVLHHARSRPATILQCTSVSRSLVRRFEGLRPTCATPSRTCTVCGSPHVATHALRRSSRTDRPDTAATL